MSKHFLLGDGVRVDTQRLQRFWAKVEKTSECWLWRATTNGNGYGIFRGGKGRDKYGSSLWILAHRFSFELANGPIPDGLDIDHICRVRNCVNPDHLRAVSHRENVLAGESPSAKQNRRSKCIRGHVFDLVDKTGRRRCSICDRAKEERRYLRRYGRVPKPNSRRRR